MSLRSIQRKYMQTAAITDKMIQEEDINKNYLDIILNEHILSEFLGKPLFPAYHLTRHKAANYAQHNSNTQALNSDTNIISDVVNETADKLEALKRLKRNADILFNQMFSEILEFTERIAKEMNLYAEVFVEEFVDTNYIDTGIATAEIDVENHRCLAFSKPNNIIRMSEVDENAISVRLTKGESFAMHGKMKNILKLGNRHPICFKIHSTNDSGVEGAITIPIRSKEANVISVFFDATNKLQVGTSIVTPDGKRITLSNKRTVTGSVYDTFKPTTLTEVDINFRLPTPTNIISDGYIYSFDIFEVYIDRLDYASTSILQSRTITTKRPFTEVILRTKEVKPTGSDIEYEISTDEKIWQPIVPSSDDIEQPVAVGDKAPVMIDNVTETTTQRWRTISPCPDHGNTTLYNILEYTSNNILDIPSDKQIAQNTLKVYRGYDTYSTQEKIVETTNHVTGIEYIYDLNDPSPLSLNVYTDIVNESKAVSETYTVELKYTPKDDNIIITDGERKTYDVASVTGKTVQIVPGSGVMPRQRVFITYQTYLETIESEDNVYLTIDKESIIVYTTKDLDETGKLSSSDFSYNETSKHLNLSRNAKLDKDKTGNSYTIYVSFTFMSKTKQKSKFYEASFLLDEPKEIIIFGFTPEETALGNFHIIDGKNVSQSKSILLKPGWHIIQTTQPYKTDPTNPNDVNDYTKKLCTAGVLLNTEVYTEMIAYSQPLRQVDTFRLANIIAPANHKSFAIEDNKILLNFIPESLPKILNSINSHLRGHDILCKRATYIDDREYTFDKYEIVPDSFRITYSLVAKEGEEDAITTLYYRASMTRDENEDAGSPYISRIELLTR